MKDSLDHFSFKCVTWPVSYLLLSHSKQNINIFRFHRNDKVQLIVYLNELWISLDGIEKVFPVEFLFYSITFLYIALCTTKSNVIVSQCSGKKIISYFSYNVNSQHKMSTVALAVVFDSRCRFSEISITIFVR